LYSIQKLAIKLTILILLLSNIFEYIYHIIRIIKLIILLLSNLSQIAILVSLLTYFFFVIKNYLLQLNLKLFEVFFNNNIFEACCNIKSLIKSLKSLKFCKTFFVKNLFKFKLNK